MKKYRITKQTIRDDCDCGWKRITLGYFPSKKSAMAFAHYQDNVEMWKKEYKTVMAIITLTIELDTINDDGDLDNSEMLWLFD